MASFGREEYDEDEVHDPQQPGQGDGGGFMSSDDDGFPDQQQPDDPMSEDDDDGDFSDHQPNQQQQGDPFTASLTEAIRSFTDAGFHGPDGSYSERYYVDLDLDLAGGGDHYFAAIAALEAAEAPADDCCAVCLDDDAGEWSRLAACGHRFHAACVGEWLRVKLSCPVCRRPAAAAEPPLPDIVNEMLAMSFEESVMFENSPRWLAFLADPDGFSSSAENSSS